MPLKREYKRQNMLTLKGLIIIFIIIILTNTCSAQNPTGLSLKNNPEAIKDIETRVIINKTFNDNPVELIYNITTPKVDRFDFILALDCSGSMGYVDANGEGQFTRSRAVSVAVPSFIEQIPQKYINKIFNVSIICWNEKIDYIYGDKNGASNTTLMPIKIAAADISAYPIFYKNGNKSNPYYYPIETTTTDYSLPVKTSLDIFNKSQEKSNFFRTSRFIILVTGPGEFHPSDNELIEAAYIQGIPIYIIAMNVYEEDQPLLYHHLWKIANDNKTQISFISATKEQLEPALMTALEDTFKRAVSRPVAKNVTITDTLNSYLTPNITAGIRVNGLPDKIILKSNYYDDTSKTNVITFELLDQLMPESSTFVTIPIDLALYGLPISVTSKTIPIIINPGTNKMSTINYTWFNELPADSELPEGHIDIVSNNQNIRSNSIYPKAVNSKSQRTGFLSFLSGIFSFY